MRKSLQSIFIALFTAIVFVAGCKKDDTSSQGGEPLAATIKVLSEVTSTTAIAGGVNPYYSTETATFSANGIC